MQKVRIKPKKSFKNCLMSLPDMVDAAYLSGK